MRPPRHIPRLSLGQAAIERRRVGAVRAGPAGRGSATASGAPAVPAGRRAREPRQAGDGELERQRQPVPAAADLGHSRCVGFGQLEVGLGVASAGDEERDRRYGGERVQVNGSVLVRQRERGDSDDLLVGHARTAAQGRGSAWESALRRD